MYRGKYTPSELTKLKKSFSLRFATPSRILLEQTPGMQLIRWEPNTTQYYVPMPWRYYSLCPNIHNLEYYSLTFAPTRIRNLDSKVYSPFIPNQYEHDRPCMYYYSPTRNWDSYKRQFETPDLNETLNNAIILLWDTWFNYDNYGELSMHPVWRYFAKQRKRRATNYHATPTILKYWSSLSVDEILDITAAHPYQEKTIREAIGGVYARRKAAKLTPGRYARWKGTMTSV